MVLPFSLSKPQRISVFFIKILFVVYLNSNVKFVHWNMDILHGSVTALSYNNAFRIMGRISHSCTLFPALLMGNGRFQK